MAKLSGPMADALDDIKRGTWTAAKPNTLAALKTRGLIEPWYGDSGQEHRLTEAGQMAHAEYWGESPISWAQALAMLETADVDEAAMDEEDPIVSIKVNRKDRRDYGRQLRIESRAAARQRDARVKKWGRTYRPANPNGQVTDTGVMTSVPVLVAKLPA